MEPTRRGALRLLGLAGLGTGAGLTMPVSKAGGLALGQGLNALSVECETEQPCEPFSWERREALRGLMMHVPGMTDSVPAHIAALKSVQPWAKVVMTRNHQRQRKTFIEKVEDLFHKGQLK